MTGENGVNDAVLHFPRHLVPGYLPPSPSLADAEESPSLAAMNSTSLGLPDRLIPRLVQIPHRSFPSTCPPVASSLNSLPKPSSLRSPLVPRPAPSTHQLQQLHHRQQQPKTQDDGIPADLVKTLVKFKSRHNFIRVLQINRGADHPFAGARLLLLDAPGNIHSISFVFKSLTDTYFDVFATLPPILPPGPLGVLGFGAGSAARLILELYPEVVVHGWELDPSVISVGREYFGLSKLEKQYKDRLFVYIGNALQASVKGGFAGILVDLFSKGCLIPELQDPNTWVLLKNSLRRGGRIMVNVGGSCVEAEDSLRDGKVLMEESLKAMHQAFPGQVLILNLGHRKEDSCVALTGNLLASDAWREELPRPLKSYTDMWMPFGE